MRRLVPLVLLALGAPVWAQDAPQRLVARAGETEVVLHWDPAPGATGYRVLRAVGGGPFEEIARPEGPHHVDRAVASGTAYAYAVRALYGAAESAGSAPAEATPGPLSDDAFLALVQALAFDFFWYEANPANGLVRDRSTAGSASSIAAVGFGLTALGVGAERGLVTRAEAVGRALATLRFLWTAPQGPEPTGTAGYKGFFYHFLDMQTGLRAGTSELSTIDTALLMAGVLYAGAYFDGPDPGEAEIRALARQLYERVEWTWAQPRPPLVSLGWHPERGFLPFDYGGYSEAMLLYLLALGSPTYPIGPEAWTRWTSSYRWGTHYGLSFVEFPPLFGHQYTHAWVDFRGIRDPYMRTRGLDYHENSRRATLAQRAYAISNPLGHPNYGPDEWGLTASDGPDGYRARGTPPAQNDDGTISPTAAGGSVAFAPAEATRALRRMYTRYPNNLWGAYGFRDAYNIRRVWFARDFLGIDQGPFVLMVENLQTGHVWDVMRNVEPLQRGLARAGFQPVATSAEGDAPAGALTLNVAPNPARGPVRFAYALAHPAHVRLAVFDAQGREVAVLADAPHAAGAHEAAWEPRGLAAGVYLARLDAEGARATRTLVLLSR